MSVNHSNCSPESRAFCDALLKAFQDVYPDAARYEKTKSCAFAIGDSNRFAYLYHKSTAPVAPIYFRGDPATKFPETSNGITPTLRDKLSGKWAREFPYCIRLPYDSQASEIAALLLTYSLPLAKRKQRNRDRSDHVNGFALAEGKPRSILCTKYERRAKLRKICLTHFGYTCRGCLTSMADTYGPIASEMIHVHHLNPVATTGECLVDPIRDLCPLCPNCHAVVHLQDPPLTIDELQALLKSS